MLLGDGGVRAMAGQDWHPHVRAESRQTGPQLSPSMLHDALKPKPNAMPIRKSVNNRNAGSRECERERVRDE